MLLDSYALGELVYRKWHVYDMNWGEQFNLDDYTMCGCSFGGPIAFLKNNEDKSNKLIVIPNSVKEANAAAQAESSKQVKVPYYFWIYNACGNLLAQVDYTLNLTNSKPSQVVALGWTEAEQFVMVFVDGNALIYNIHGKLLKHLLMWESNQSIHVLECKIYGNGIVVLASDFFLYTAEVL